MVLSFLGQITQKKSKSTENLWSRPLKRICLVSTSFELGGSMSTAKIFVLDTNVILHDHACMRSFGGNAVVLPIAVLEELDNFKKGNENIHFQARQFVRELDTLSGDKLFDRGVKLGPELGYLKVDLTPTFHHDLMGLFDPSKPDHQILNTAYSLMKNHTDRQIFLITKDVNLRMKAKAIGLLSQDYLTDQIADIHSIYQGMHTEESFNDEEISQLYQENGKLTITHDLAIAPTENEYMVIKGNASSALGVYRNQAIYKVDKNAAYGIKPKNSEQNFALEALLNPDIQLVTISGKAGTGKTLLALASALEQRKYYRQIFIARPVVALSNKDIGFLPGDINSKLDPYMQPLFDNLSVIQNQFENTSESYIKINKMIENEKLKIAPLAYIRGRSLNNIFFIIDEAQNLSPHEVKTIITRAGEGTKIIFTGDINQIDHPYLDSHTNGLSSMIGRMKGQKLYAHVNLERGERSELADLASDLL